MHQNSNLSCLNCGASMSSDASFCEACGQAKLESRLNIVQLVKDFISNIFNLDGRLIRSVKHMWRPAFLATEYTSGKRRSYVNPIRFFLAMLVIAFFLLNNAMNSEAFDKGTMNAISNVEQKKYVATYDSTICVLAPDISIEKELALRNAIFGQIKEKPTKIFVGGNIMMWKLKEYEVTRNDAYTMEIDSLFAKYNLTKWYDQLFIKQLIKVDKDRSGSASYFVSKLIWGVLVFIFLLALLMKLLYIRSVYYYVEHLIVVILSCAKMLLVFNLIFLIQFLELNIPYINVFAAIVYFSSIIYFFFTLKKYYNQGVFKTIVKTLTIYFAGFYIFIFSVALVLLASLAFF